MGKTEITSSEKPTGQQISVIFPCWFFLTFQFTKSVKNLEKMHKIFEILKFLCFLFIFGVNLRHFFQNIATIFSLKTTRQPIPSLLTP